MVGREKVTKSRRKPEEAQRLSPAGAEGRAGWATSTGTERWEQISTVLSRQQRLQADSRCRRPGQT